jgi:hypothetical protein
VKKKINFEDDSIETSLIRVNRNHLLREYAIQVDRDNDYSDGELEDAMRDFAQGIE